MDEVTIYCNKCGYYGPPKETRWMSHDFTLLQNGCQYSGAVIQPSPALPSQDGSAGA